MFVLDIYNEKSEDLSTIHLSQFLFCPYAIIPPCNYICQIYLLKKEREREREKKENYCLLFVSSVQQGCALAEPGGPVAPNFCPRATRKSQIFHTNHTLGTLDFTDSEDWAPFNFP